MSERVGDIAFVLHSHMPYVEGFGTYPFGEEWLFDAVVRSHLPVLSVAADVTLSVTPVLADQLEAPGVGKRLTEFTREFRVGSAELDARDVEPELAPACEAEAARYRAALAELERLEGDALAAFAEARAEGRVELLASAASHAVLPLVATRGGGCCSSTRASPRTGAASASRTGSGSRSAPTIPASRISSRASGSSTSASIALATSGLANP